MKNHKAVHSFIIGSFVSLYLLVSTISCIHVIDFFQLTNNFGLAVTLAIAFEVGAAASLASLIVLEKMNRTLVFFLFILLTLMQAMGNSFYAYMHANNFQGWIELFGLADADLIQQKRILSIVSGAILPIVALGFIKSLVDYIKPDIEPDVYANVPKEPNVSEPIVEETVVHQEISSDRNIVTIGNEGNVVEDIPLNNETIEPEMPVEPVVISVQEEIVPIIPEPISIEPITETDSPMDEPIDDDKKKT